MSTLILINVDYGDLLTRSLENIQLALGSLKLPLQDMFLFTHNYSIRTRGKLTWAEIDPLLLVNIPVNSIVYIVSSYNDRYVGYTSTSIN